MSRALYVVLGMLSLGLGIIGAMLPVMPTTVFVLIAGACFARGSTRYDRWLCSHRWFGPMVLDWREHRCISTRARRIAIAMIVVTISGSLLVIPIVWVRAMLGFIALALVLFLLRLPSRESILDAASPHAVTPAPPLGAH